MKNSTQYTLTITEDQLFDFFRHYDKFGPKQKKIFSYIQWYCRRFPNAFPRQEKIAMGCACSRKHVNKTLQTFQNLGWVFLISRGAHRSKTLCMVDGMVQVQVNKRQYFRRTEVTTEVTHSSSITKRNGKAGVFFAGLEQKVGPPLNIPDYIEKTRLTKDHKLKLSLVPENFFRTALDITKAKHAKGLLPNDDPERIERYVVGTALSLAKKHKHPIAWHKYYEAIGRTA